MALPINIDDVIHGRTVEWERLEFKEGWNPLEVVQSMCAFANDFHNLSGGYIFIGIAEDSGRPLLPPTGISPTQIDIIQRKLLNLSNLIHPHYFPVVEPYDFNGKYVLALMCLGGQNRPYKVPVSLAKDSKEKAYYIRKNSSTVRATHDEEIELVNLAAQIPFDDRTNQQSNLNDLNLALVQSYLTEIGSQLDVDPRATSPLEICRKMQIVDGPTESIFPRNVGLMFFNEHPERFFPQTQIDVVHFPDGAGGNIIFERQFQGPISSQLRNTLSYFRNNVIEEVVIKRDYQAEADRFFNYPYAALEEVLVNAVYHRDYQIREPIEVRIEPERITITSFPGPDRSISLQDLTNGTVIARRYRNRRIGEFLKDLHLTEGRSTGIPKVIRAMRENESARPEFTTDENRTYFTAILPMRSLQETSGVNNLEQTLEIFDGYLDIGAGALRTSLGRSRILRLVAELKARQTLSTGEAARLIDANVVTARRYLLQLEDSGLVQEQARSRFDPAAVWKAVHSVFWAHVPLPEDLP